MNKQLVLFLSMLGFSCIVNASIAINTCADLQNIQNNIGESYYLSQDIDCSNDSFQPIPVFSGTLDGRGHVINNMNGTLNTATGVFFTTLEHAMIKNIQINGHASFSVPYKQVEYVGFLAAQANDSEFQGIALNVTLNDESEQIEGIGALAGKLVNPKVQDVTVKLELNSGAKSVGGIAGVMEINGSDSYYIRNNNVKQSTLRAQGTTRQMGALAGYAINVSFENNVVLETTLDGGGNVGGLVGKMISAPRIAHNAVWNVKIQNAFYAAGGAIGSLESIFQKQQSTIEENFVGSTFLRYEVDVHAKNYAGGFIGQSVAAYDTILKNNVVGETNIYLDETDGTGIKGAGGFLGYLAADGEKRPLIFKNNLTTAHVMGTTFSGGFTGALLNEKSAQFEHNFWDTDNSPGVGLTSGLGNEGGYSTSNLQQASLYMNEGWDNKQIWIIINGGYPILRVLPTTPL